MEFITEGLIYKCESYVEFLNFLLARSFDKKARKPRGSLIRLAQHLSCHPSFIAQVLSGRAHLNIDQAILVCEHFRMEELEKDHFIDLLMEERAATASAKAHFKKRLQARSKARNNLSERWTAPSDFSQQESWIFFSSWLNQVVYSLLQIPAYSTVQSLAVALELPVGRIESTIKILESMKLVKKSGKRFLPLENSLHLSRNSSSIRSHHQTWRLRAIQEVTCSELTGLHYSGAITLSKVHAQELREKLLAFLDYTRKTVVQSESEVCYSLLIDFFSVR